MPNLNAAVIV